MDRKNIIAVLLAIILILILAYRNTTEKFTTEDIQTKAFELFDKTKGKLTYTELKNKIPSSDVDAVTYADLKAKWANMHT